MNIADFFRRSAVEPLFDVPVENDAWMVAGGSLAEHGFALSLADLKLSDAERIRLLARHSQAQSVVFQSVAVSSLQMLDRVLSSERRLADTALSLGQQEMIGAMIASLEVTVEAVKSTLTAQGSKMLAMSARPISPHDGEQSWWYGLSDAMHLLEEATAWVSAAVAGQPKGSASRTLSSIVARLLHSHYNMLHSEASQWMD